MINSNHIESLIHQNLQDMQFCVARLALLLEISPSHLRVVVRKMYNMQPNQLIRRMRMARAREMLSRLEKVQTVSRSVGYSTTRSFRGAFKKDADMRPKDFKKLSRTSLSR